MSYNNTVSVSIYSLTEFKDALLQELELSTKGMTDIGSLITFREKNGPKIIIPLKKYYRLKDLSLERLSDEVMDYIKRFSEEECILAIHFLSIGDIDPETNMRKHKFLNWFCTINKNKILTCTRI